MNIDYKELSSKMHVYKHASQLNSDGRFNQIGVYIPYLLSATKIITEFITQESSIRSVEFETITRQVMFTPLAISLNLTKTIHKKSNKNSKWINSKWIAIHVLGYTVSITLQPEFDIQFVSQIDLHKKVVGESYLSKFAFTATALTIAQIFRNVLSSYAIPFLSMHLGPVLGEGALFFAELGISLPYSLFIYRESTGIIITLGKQIKDNIACLFDTQHEQSERYKHAAYLLLLVGSASAVFTYTLPLVSLAIQSCVPARLSLYLTQIGVGRYIDLARFTTTYALSTQLFTTPVGKSQKPVLRHAVDSVSNFIPFTNSTGKKA